MNDWDDTRVPVRGILDWIEKDGAPREKRCVVDNCEVAPTRHAYLCEHHRQHLRKKWAEDFG